MTSPDYKPGREVSVTSPTGGQKGQKSIRLGGSDPLAMLELGRVYGVGETKYDRFNYLKGYAWSLSLDALKRHLLAFEAGQEYDECSKHPGQHDDDHEFDPAICDGSGLLHTAHVAWHGLTLTSFIIRSLGEDDRAPRLEPGERPTIEQTLERAGYVDAAVVKFAQNVVKSTGLPEEFLDRLCAAGCKHPVSAHEDKPTGWWCRTCMDIEANDGHDPMGVGPCW